MATLPRFRALLLLAVTTACWLTVAPAQATETTPTESPFDQAMDAYERNHWGVAFNGLAALADAGHGEAARMAWLMSRHGTTLFRTQLDADPARRQRWLALAVSQPAATAQATGPALLTAKLRP